LVANFLKRVIIFLQLIYKAPWQLNKKKFIQGLLAYL